MYFLFMYPDDGMCDGGGEEMVRQPALKMYLISYLKLKNPLPAGQLLHMVCKTHVFLSWFRFMTSQPEA